MRELLEKMISDHSGRPVEEVSRDIERDKILTAQGAVEYGLIDSVLESAQGHPRPDLTGRPRRTLLVSRAKRGPGGVPSGSLPQHRPVGLDPEDDRPWHASVTVATCSSAPSAGRARSRSRS